jgi:hypothetical protein
MADFKENPFRVGRQEVRNTAIVEGEKAVNAKTLGESMETGEKAFSTKLTA